MPATEIAKQIEIGNVKVTPDFLIQGDGNLEGILENKISGTANPFVAPRNAPEAKYAEAAR